MIKELLDVSDRLGRSPGYSYVATTAGGATIYSAGAVPIDRDGKLTAPGDLEEQTRSVIANLTVALSAAGVTPTDVVKTTIYVASVDREDLSMVWRVYAESDYVDAPSTLVGVTVLGYDGQLVEIEAVAAS